VVGAIHFAVDKLFGTGLNGVFLGWVSQVHRSITESVIFELNLNSPNNTG
jgi:hypothetical protein